MQQLRLQNEELRARSGHRESEWEQRPPLNIAEAEQAHREVSATSHVHHDMAATSQRETRHSYSSANSPDHDMERAGYR